MAAAWAATPGGLRLAIRLTPRGGRDGLDGVAVLADGRAVLKVRVRALPQDGQANAALIALLARLLAIPPSQVTLVAGATARIKTVALKGDTAALAARLVALAEAAGAGAQ